MHDSESSTCKVCGSATQNATWHKTNSLYGDNIHGIDDKTGDQAAHISARLNHVGCFKILIQNHARMGKKNFAGLTPLGEARMNGNTDIVNLIKDNYTTNASSSNRLWDEELNSDGWVQSWCNERQKPQWERRLPNGVVESSFTPPPADYQLVLKARQRCERQVVNRIHSNSSVLTFERQRRAQQERLELVLKQRQQIVQERCVTKLQALFRQRKAHRTALYLRAQTIAANRIKRRLRYIRQKRRYLACVKLQSFFRMTEARVYYREFLRERLSFYRSSRTLACLVQRLWLGFKGRRLFRRHLEIATLPNPDDARNHDCWVQLQIEAGPATRELGVYAEYILSGNPRSWRERNLVKRNGQFFRDVSFYANTITRRASWTKPKAWIFNDIKEYYALRVQTFWRARVAKRKIKLLVKANQLLTNTFDSENASDIVSLCNYTFYVHVHLHDYEKARPLYAKMMSYMEMRVDNAFVLYSYAIFAAVSGEQDWEKIKDYVRRAKLQEERRRKRERLAAAASVYDISSTAFYLQAVSNEDSSGGSENWHNYAMLQMLVHQDLSGARSSFLRAMKLSPNNKTLSSNFNMLLQDNDYLGLPTTVHEEYRRALRMKYYD